MKFKKQKITKELLSLIPGGSHTYSRGYDQFPSNAPQILSKGKGAYVYDNKNKKYLDYLMSLRAVNLGYNEKNISKAAIKEIYKGNNLSRPSEVELKAAKKLIKTVKSAEMVKFTKNGSTAVTAAIKLARAYTKKDLILRCLNHPFFSYDDWFIGSTNIKRGIPKSTQTMTKYFKYNDLIGLNNLIKKYRNKIACIVLEPASQDCPNIYKKENKVVGCCGKEKCDRNFKRENNFLKEVQSICKKNKIVFILDEMITGFRWSINGAQDFYGVKPDLTTFGKAMSNGFSLAAVCGKKDIMKLGSIEFKGEERVFLLSTTYGAEMMSLGAFIATVEFLKKRNVIKKIWNYGFKFKKIFNSISEELKISKFIKCYGPACAPYYFCKNKKLKISNKFKTLFLQEMAKNRILISPSWISFSYSHGNKELEITKKALKKTLLVYKKAISKGINKYLKSDVVKPVFRKYN